MISEMENFPTHQRLERQTWWWVGGAFVSYQHAGRDGVHTHSHILYARSSDTQ